MSYDTILLEHLQLGLNHTMTRRMMPKPTDLRMTQQMAMANADNLVHSIVMTWTGLKSSHHVHYPMNWVEAVKARFLPEWAKKRWPVRYTQWNVDAWRLWEDLPPHIKDTLGKWGREVRVVIPRPFDPSEWLREDR
jgi:hypothetical protein